MRLCIDIVEGLVDFKLIDQGRFDCNFITDSGFQDFHCCYSCQIVDVLQAKSSTTAGLVCFKQQHLESLLFPD